MKGQQISYILKNIHHLNKKDKMVILNRYAQSGVRIHAHGDGSRVNLDLLATNMINWTYQWVKNCIERSVLKNDCEAASFR